MENKAKSIVDIYTKRGATAALIYALCIAVIVLGGVVGFIHLNSANQIKVHEAQCAKDKAHLMQAIEATNNARIVELTEIKNDYKAQANRTDSLATVFHREIKTVKNKLEN